VEALPALLLLLLPPPPPIKVAARSPPVRRSGDNGSVPEVAAVPVMDNAGKPDALMDVPMPAPPWCAEVVSALTNALDALGDEDSVAMAVVGRMGECTRPWWTVLAAPPNPDRRVRYALGSAHTGVGGRRQVLRCQWGWGRV